MSVMNGIFEYLAKSRMAVVLGILGMSVLMLFWAGQHLGFLGQNDSSVVSGTVTKVLFEQKMEGYTEQDVRVRLEEGTEITAKNRLVPFQEGSRVYVTESIFQGETEDLEFSVVEVNRMGGLAVLFALFMVAVLWVGGTKGFRSLVGLVFSFAVILSFIVPQILVGQNAIMVSLAGAGAILLGTLYVAHGFNKKSFAALGGIFTSLVVVGVLAQISSVALRFTGLASEGALFLLTLQEGVVAFNLVDLVIAGIIIAGIGVLDDVAITQAATVFSLADNSNLRGRKLFAKAMDVGKDHISAVVNTLVLAYVGAGLPLVLLFTLSQSPVALTASNEIVAVEIARTLISSIGLVIAIPLTTALSVFFLRASKNPLPPVS